MLLLIPFDRKIDWSHPPWVTLALVVINVLCFVLWQGGDDARLEAAIDYYFDSGLAAQEIPYFIEHQGRELASGELSENHRRYLVAPMLMDSDFQEAVAREVIVSRWEPEYAQWRSSRDHFEALMERVVFIEYGFRTAEPSVADAFAHMFLHADWSHLLGNMFFLVAVGFLVEMTLGWFVFLAAYLIAGLASAGFYYAFAEPSLIPGIGASGAISGLMGMYTVLYWIRPVRFFYFFIAYFDYVRLPAIILLPLWVGNEAAQLWIDRDSNINYLAHLGGLLGGALIGGLIRGLPSFSMARVEHQDNRNELEKGLEQAADLCRRLEYDKARALLRRLRRLEPGNIEVLALLRETVRTDTSSEEYHALSRQLMELPGSDLRSNALVHETFEDYIAHARPKPRISAELACRLATRFVREGKIDAATMLARRLVKRALPCPQLRAIVAGLADFARSASDAENLARFERWQRLLDTRGED